MSDKEKNKMLKEYIKLNIAPILVDFIEKDFINDKVVISSNCKKEELNEIYEQEKTLPPKWYQELINKNKKILIINNLDSISNEEQKKFIEILKYRKVSTFKLPQDVRIIITTTKKVKNNIDKEIFNLVLYIGG